MPHYDWNPSNPVLMDIETQSVANLRQVGSKAYLRHPSTRLLSAVFLIGQTYHVWVPMGRSPVGVSGITWNGSTPPPEVNEAIGSGATFVAHNAESFDAPAWERLVGGPQPSWYDTIHCCRAAGLPAGLDRASKAIGGSGKDEHGAKALAMLYTAKIKAGRVWYPTGTVALWEAMLRYNIQDVAAMKAVYEYTLAYGEPDVMAMNEAVNARGVYVDLPLARTLRNLWNEYQGEAREAISADTDNELSGDDARSPAKVKAWLKKQGLNVPSLNRAQVDQLMNDPDSYFGDTDNPTVAKVTAVLLNRQNAARATVGKVERVFTAVDDDSRVRGLFVYHGAHTGRFTGRELQPHNMPRGNGCSVDVDSPLTLAMVKQATPPGGNVGDSLATLFRPIIRAKPGSTLAIVDYAGIEARGVAWLAGERGALDCFLDHKKDIYKDMAGKLFGKVAERVSKEERYVGKVIVLGCGYGMGANKFGVTAKLLGADLAKLGITPEQCVEAYRAAYPAIAGYRHGTYRAGGLWQELQKALELVTFGGFTFRGGKRVPKEAPQAVAFTHKCTFTREGSSVVITLPSGRKLTYRDIGYRLEQSEYGPRWQVTYAHPRGYRATLYGGKLAENIVQAFSRDIMVTHALAIDPLWPIVLHVHDEIASEVDSPESLYPMGLLMSTPPAWCADFPLRVEGFTSVHYSKSKGKDSLTIDAMRGVRL